MNSDLNSICITGTVVENCEDWNIVVDNKVTLNGVDGLLEIRHTRLEVITAFTAYSKVKYKIGDKLKILGRVDSLGRMVKGIQLKRIVIIPDEITRVERDLAED